MADINKFSLGKKGKLGEIDFNKIKSGLKASDLIKNNPNLKSIFERLDKNGNGELDRSELEALRELIAKLSGDDNLSINEAKKLKDNDEKIGRSKAKLLIEFLNKMSENAKAQGIKNVETNTGGGIEVVTYEDGHTEELFQDGSVVITVKDGNKTTKTHKDKKGNLLKETTTEDGNETKTNYTNGKKVNKIITKKNSVETINYDSTGIPKNKTVKENKSGIEDYYEYENGKFVLKKRTDSKNNSETVYNGTRATTTKTDGKNKDVTVRENGEVIRNTSTRINDDNKTEMTDTIYNGDDYTENFYLNDALRRQKKSIDGKEYEVHYDADGNTEGIIVQNGESIALIAKRFNCSVTDLIRVNALKVRGKYPKAYFVVGETIKIPNQMEADDYAKIQAGRKSRTEVLGDYRRIEEEKRTKAEQKAAEAQQKAEKAAQKRKEAENKSKKVEAKKIAQEIFDACDDEAAAIGKNRFQNALKRVNSNNVIDVLKAYKEIRPEESIIAVIANEKGSSCSVRKEASKYLARVLYAKGLAVGVDKNELDKLLAEFNKEVNAQYDKIGVVKCDQMETILDAMLGSVIAKMQKTEEISEADAIKQAGEIAAGDSSNANKDFNSAREDEGWIAKVSDTVCGWFGCKTIGEMKEKLGEYAGEIMKLVNAKNENEFKKIFKEVFGIEFDKQKVAAYNTAVENYSLAIFYSEAGKVLPGLIRAGSTLSENNFKGEIKKKLNYSDADLEMLIFANAKEGESVTDTLIRCLNDLDKTYKSELAKLTKGGSLDDMAKDIDLIKKGLFGTKDIVKEVNIFNKNMQITEAVGTGVFEILGTVALGFIPGGQALAGARIAAMTARYGRLAKVAAKGLKVLSTSVNAGIASATVLATDGRDMKEIKQHIKMNMSFAAGGVVAGELAPFVAKTFKLTSNIAKELIEDTMDVFVSYCTSKGLGMEYAKTDAGVDFLVGLIMARVAHMNLKAKSAKTGDVSNTPKAEQKAEAPKAEQKAEAPKAEQKAEAPKAEQKAEAPKAEQKAEAPKAEQKAEAPKAEQKAEAPKAEQKAEAPKAEQKTEAPKAEQKAEAPKAEQKQKTDKSDKTEKKTETSETKSTSKAEKAEDTKKSGFSADELKQKLGKKLARSYKAIEEAIEKMKDTVDFNKIYKRITVKFKDYAEVAADLINKLKLKAKQLGLKIEKQFDDIKTERANRANSTRTYSAGRTTAKGCINSNEYSFYNFYDLRNTMADKFNLFSQDTQNKILQDLGRTGKCRLQKNGIEYQFTVNNGRVRLDEFDINVKYDIKHYQIDEYTTQKTCSIDDMDDLWWAIHDELNLFSIDSQNLIMQKLRNSETLVLRKYGIQYEFKMDRSGNVTVSEFAYEKFYNASTYQKANRNQSASSADNAQNYGRNMKPETRQAIEDLKGKIREKNTTIKALENQIENLKKKFMLPDYKVREYKTMLGIPENAQVTEISLKKAYNKKALETHPDKGGNAETFKKIQAANEALRKHFGFDDTRNKIQTETAELRQEIKNAKEEIEKYEAKINKLMNE